MTGRPELDADFIVTEYSAAVSVQEIARSMGIHPHTVRRILSEKGIPVLGRDEAQKRYADRRHAQRGIDETQVLAMYADLQPEQAVAKHFGCCRDTIRKILLRNGVTPRNGKDAAQIRIAQGRAAALGSKRPDARKRMTANNPIRMPGIANKRAVSVAATYRANPSPAEARFEQALNNLGLVRGQDYKFQWPCGRYIIDFLFPTRFLIVEIDGRGHRSRMGRQAERDAYMAERGFETIRVPCDGRQTHMLCGELHGKAIEALRRATGKDVVSSPDLFSSDPSSRG